MLELLAEDDVVAGLPIDRVGDDVETLGHVFRDRDLRRLRTDELREPLPARRHQALLVFARAAPFPLRIDLAMHGSARGIRERRSRRDVEEYRAVGDRITGADLCPIECGRRL